MSIRPFVCNLFSYSGHFLTYWAMSQAYSKPLVLIENDNVNWTILLFHMVFFCWLSLTFVVIVNLSFFYVRWNFLTVTSLTLSCKWWWQWHKFGLAKCLPVLPLAQSLLFVAILGTHYSFNKKWTKNIRYKRLCYLNGQRGVIGQSSTITKHLD